MKTLSIYLDKRIGSIFVLGILSGLPWVMIGSALTLWLKEAGVSRSGIGFAGLIFFVYAINFFWAPFIDRFAPTFGLKLGAKQAWVTLCQCVIGFACLAMSQIDPAINAKALVLVALLLAIASATQDIAIDAYRIQSFEPEQTDKISAGAAAATGGWWTGYAAIGFIPLALSDVGFSWSALYVGFGVATLATAVICSLLPSAQTATKTELTKTALVPVTRSLHDKYRLIALLISPWLFAIWAVFGWGLPAAIIEASVYVPVSMAVVIALFINALRTLSQKEVVTLAGTANGADKLLANTYQTLILPLQDFFKRNGAQLAMALLGFIFLFKMGEAFLGRMSIVFYKELGFSSTQIAFYSKTMTWVVTLLSAIPAGILNAKFGIYRGLFISGILMAASNLLFCALALMGPVEWLYAITIVVDGFTAAWATVAFVAFVSRLCNLQFSATQYALLASLGNLGRTTIASNSGLVVDSLDGNWAIFFALTAVMVVPGLYILWRLKDRLPRTD